MINFIPGYYGWLGNQMFQYAAVYAASKKINAQCGFPNNKPNLFDIFNLSAKQVNHPQKMLYQEPSFTYQNIPEIDDITLAGYFQSEKYFKHIENDLRQEFTFKNIIQELNDKYVSIHVRRGDYLDLKDHHPLCSIDYYKQAMSYFPNSKFLVFSNDLDWCKANLVGENIFYSEGYSAEEDLQRMSLCEHQIIANSSFSWWASWLNKNTEKVVVAPKHWFGPAKPLETKDLYCMNWIIL